jgi:predicted transglutaminase-like cysteine proteinase
MSWIDPWGTGCLNPFNPEFWANLFGGNKKPAPPDPNSNRALLNDEGLTPGTFTDQNGHKVSAGKCAALVCGAVAAGALSAMTDGLGDAGKAEQLRADALKAEKAAKEIKAVRDAENALNKAKDIEETQRKERWKNHRSHHKIAAECKQIAQTYRKRSELRRRSLTNESAIVVPG